MSRRALRVGTQAAVALGGVAALSWEILWQLEISLSLGISALGTALTLAATMGGMTVGSLAMGRFLRGRRGIRPLPVYGALEAVIGVSGLALVPGFAWVERIDASVYALSPTLAPMVHVLAIVLLLGPPTLAMGATVPTFALLGRHTGSSVARLYGINTAGAAVGVLLLSFVIMPRLGVTGACLAVASVNALVWAAMGLLQRASRAALEDGAAPIPAMQAETEARCLHPDLAAQLVVFCTGFVTFALEVAWFRSLRAAFQGTTEAFAIILASVLIPLAVAARLVPRLRRHGVAPRLPLALAGVAILLATPLVERMDLMIAVPWTYWPMIGLWLLLSLMILGPAILFLGMPLPWYLEEFPEPGATGRLYALNTLGAIGGSLVAAWLLLPLLGFARCAWLLGAGCAALALVARGRLGAPKILAAGAVALAVAVVFTSSLGRDRVQSPNDVSHYRILAFDEGPDSTVAVVESPAGVRELLIDGFTATSELPDVTNYMEWMGRLPMLLHPDPQRALVICFGTGQTANAVRRERAEHLDVVDVDGTVFEMAPLFRSNEGVLDDPSVNAVVMDGRAWLRRVDTLYDVVTLEPMPPYFAGVNALYSREFYEIVAKRLGPGGVVAQWLPTHLLPPYFAASVAATFQAVFPDAVLWIDPGASTGVLLGRRAGGPTPLIDDWPGLDRLISRPLGAEAILRAAVLDARGLRRYGSFGRVITDDNQLLAYGLVRRELLGGGHEKSAKRNLLTIRRIARETRRRPAAA